MISAAARASSGLSLAVSSVRWLPTSVLQPLPAAACSQPAPLPRSLGPPCPCSAMAARLNCAEQLPNSASAASKLPGEAFVTASAGAASAPATSALTTSVARVIRMIIVLTLQYGADPHAARGAHRDQAALRAGVGGEQLGKSRDDSRTGGGEGMAKRNAAALHVELGAIDAAERRR